MSKKLKLQYHLAEYLNKQKIVVYCGQEVVRVNGSKYFNTPQISGLISEAVKNKKLSTISSSTLFPVAGLKKIGGFDPVFRSQIDHDIWMNMAMNGWLAEFVDKPLVRSREHFNPRITSDYSTRLETINRYFEKWQPLLVKLQTPPGAAKYKIDYTNYVIGWLAREQFKQGKYVLGLCCLKLLKVHNLSSLFIYMDTLSKCGLYILLRWFYITLPIPNMFRLFPI